MDDAICDSCHFGFTAQSLPAPDLCLHCRPPFELTDREKALFEWFKSREAHLKVAAELRRNWDE